MCILFAREIYTEVVWLKLTLNPNCFHISRLLRVEHKPKFNIRGQLHGTHYDCSYEIN